MFFIDLGAVTGNAQSKRAYTAAHIANTEPLFPIMSPDDFVGGFSREWFYEFHEAPVCFVWLTVYLFSLSWKSVDDETFDAAITISNNKFCFFVKAIILHHYVVFALDKSFIISNANSIDILPLVTP